MQVTVSINDLQQGRKEDRAALTKKMQDIGQSSSASIMTSITRQLNEVKHVTNVTNERVGEMTVGIKDVETTSQDIHNKAIGRSYTPPPTASYASTPIMTSLSA